MKKISVLLMVLFALSIGVQANDEKVKFNEVKHDFGTIEEKGGKVSFDFVITNISQTPLVIEKVRASCGCTTPSWTKEPIESGKSGVISVSYNPSGRPGRFNKSVSIKTNLDDKNYTVFILGEVVKENRDPALDYPIAFGDLLLKSKELNFNRMTKKEQRTASIEIYNKSAKVMTPVFTNLPAYIQVVATPPSISPKGKGKLDFVLDASLAKKYGTLVDKLEYVDTASKQKYYISTQAVLLDDFSEKTEAQRKNASKINVSTEELVFNQVNTVKSAASKVLKISNSGKENLIIHTIESDNPHVTFSKKSLTIKPKEIAEIKVSVKPNAIKVRTTVNLSIYTNDPRAGIKEIKATIQP